MEPRIQYEWLPSTYRGRDGGIVTRLVGFTRVLRHLMQMLGDECQEIPSAASGPAYEAARCFASVSTFSAVAQARLE